MTRGFVTIMLLTIDVGNTQTVMGVYEDDQLLHMWRVTTNKTNTADEVRITLNTLLQSAYLDFSDITQASLASVVPALTSSWVRAIADGAGVDTILCNAETAAPLFKTTYPNPHEIGADRIADAVGAVARYGAPVVVVDFGTATNIEIIDADGAFVGGIIAPGIMTGAQALFANATRLATIDLVAPPAAIGTSTDTAVQSGIVLGEADRVDGLVYRIFAQLGYHAPVVATGGLAPLVAPHSETITHVDQGLTLEGLRLIAQ